MKRWPRPTIRLVGTLRLLVRTVGLINLLEETPLEKRKGTSESIPLLYLFLPIVSKGISKNIVKFVYGALGYDNDMYIRLTHY